MESLKGRLLISGGGLFDDNFRHTVVLIGEHGAEGAVGVVLNRPLELTVGEAVAPLATLTGADAPLFEGGPVEQQQAVLLAETAVPGILDVPIFGDVGFLTGDVPSDVRSAIRRARVFLGYAGWGPGQLEAELASGAWIVDPATADDVFTDAPRSLWRHVLERKGPRYAAMAKIPYDPSMN
jgi:putative transcriptional regulator